MAGGMFVPQMVTPVDTSFLRSIGNTIGGLKQDSELADILKGIDPYDPNSKQRVINDLRQHSTAGRDMADRMEGLDIRRGGLTLDQQKFEHEKQFGKTSVYGRGQYEAEQAREERGIEAASRLTGRPVPTEDGAVPGPRSAVPAPQQVSGGGPFNRPGGAVPSTNRTVGDQEGVDSGLYEAPAPIMAPAAAGASAAPAPGVRMAGGPLGGGPLQQLPPPPPRNVAATGPTPSPLPPASLGPMGAAPAVPAAAAPAPALVSGLGTAALPPTPPRLPQVAQAAPSGIADLVSERPVPVQRPAPTRSEGQILQELAQLSALENAKYPTNKDGIKSAIRVREKELSVIRERQDKGYQAQLDEAKGSGSKRYEHALKAADEVHKQDKQDNQTSFSLARAYKTLENGLNTGTLSDSMTWTSKIGDTAGKILEVIPGVDANRIPLVKSARNRQAAMEEFHGIAGKALMDIVGSFGKVTEKEGEKVGTMIFGMDKSITGNVRLIKFARDLVNTRQAAAQDVRNYMRQMGKDANPAHIDEIQARHFRGAVARMEAEIDADPWGLRVRGAAPAVPETSRGGAQAAPAQVPAPAARGGPATLAPPQAGDLVGGMRFKGGNPRDRNNWEPGT